MPSEQAQGVYQPRHLYIVTSHVFCTDALGKTQTCKSERNLEDTSNLEDTRGASAGRTNRPYKAVLGDKTCLACT